MEHWYRDMGIEVGEVDHVWPATEASKRRCASGDLRRGALPGKSEHDSQDCVTKYARHQVSPLSY
jgi:hypothetical protein